jgi:glycine betaine catabolism B
MEKYKITHRIQETHDVISLYLSPQTGDVLDFKPGQFVMLHLFNADGTEWRKLPYSICSSPTEKNHLHLGFKIEGEFTQKTATLDEEDLVGISGPFGRFVLGEKMKRVVMLAGGIGITPFLSMIRFATAKNLDDTIALIYANKTTNDIAFKNALQELAAKNKNFSVTFSIDKPVPGWRGETGYVTQDMVKKTCHAMKDTFFMLCGPPPFVHAMENMLAECGVKKEFIKKEKF